MKILSPAKINLFLHICGQRSDEYHKLFTLMSCVTLFDEISLQIGDGKTIEIHCSHSGVPADATNLAYRAASLFQRKLRSSQGVHIGLTKNIPVAAGLGGGSGNAASVLLALNIYYGFPFSQEQLMAMGLMLGADVPFFIFQKPAVATGIGEKLEAYEKDLPYRILLLHPGFSVSTAETYQSLNLGLTKVVKKSTSNDLKQNAFNPAHHLTNDLESVAIRKYPQIDVAKVKLMDLGAIGALMSGSGPAVFGLFGDADRAKKAEQALSADRQHKGWQIFLVDPLLDAGPKLIDV